MSGLTKVRDDFTATVEKMVSRASSFQAGAARIYKIYQKLQTERFMTEGASEGMQWSDLKPDYKEYKLKRYGGGVKRGGGNWRSWPGNGTKMLIGTSTLAGSVIGPGAPFVSTGISLHRAMFTKTSMVISVEQSGNNAEDKPFNYAGYVNEERKFMTFSEGSLQMMKDELSKYVIGE